MKYDLKGLQDCRLLFWPYSCDQWTQQYKVHIVFVYSIRLSVIRMSRCTVIRTFKVFFSEKSIVGPQEAQYPQFLLQLPLTHYILRSTFFWTPPTPPICLKMPKCVIFGLFWSFHFKDAPKVGVHREKFNIGNVAHICWDNVISFS